MNNTTKSVSVIMPIHEGTEINHAKEALQSIENQSVTPNELIIIVDGPIKNLLLKEVFFYKKCSKIDTKIVMYPINKGVGFARDIGIRKAKSDYIALMDSDDISHPDRLEKQLPVIENGYDVVGAWIAEYDDNLKVLKSTRRVPTSNEAIKKFSRFRSPVNNVTAIIRKNAYLAVGGYKSLRALEDYDLYARMILKGFQFHNIEETLVDVRAGADQSSRRGSKILKTEIFVLFKLYKTGFFGFFDFILNLVLRSFLRLLPKFFRALIYKLVRK